MITTHHCYEFIQFVTTLSHFCRLKLYYTHCIKGYISKITIPHNIIGDNEKIILNKIGNKSFITFSLLIIFLHHTCLFLLEHLNFNIKIFAKILASSCITLILILILDIFNSTKK